MSARDDLLALIEDKCRAIGHEPDMHVDAHRAEVLREAADRLEAIDPIEFALGSVDPITELRRMARETS